MYICISMSWSLTCNYINIDPINVHLYLNELQFNPSDTGYSGFFGVNTIPVDD